MADDVLEPGYSFCAAYATKGIVEYTIYSGLAGAGLHLFLDAMSPWYRHRTSTISRGCVGATTIALIGWFGGYKARRACQQRVSEQMHEWQCKRFGVECKTNKLPPPQSRPR